jgi:cobalt-zinc-cadmium efflux system outer membrane protein
MKDHKVFVLYTLLIVSLCFSASQGTGEEPAAKGKTLTLPYAMALTLARNPELKAYSYETKAAWARQLQATLRPNPELELEVEEFGGTGDSGEFDSAETSIIISQLIELGGKREKRGKVAALEAEISDIEAQSKKLELFSELTAAYIEVLAARENLELSQQLLELSRQSSEIVEKRIEAGKDSPIEKQRASIAISGSRIEYDQAQRELDFARRQLASFWGDDELEFEKVSGSITDINKLIRLEEAAAKLRNNPEYVIYETLIDREEAALELEKANSINDITIGAGVKRSNETDDNTFVVGISIPLPFWDRNQGGRQEAFYNLAKSKELQRAGWLNLKKEFNRAYQDYFNAYKSAAAIKDDVLPAAQELYEAAQSAYKQGKADHLSLLDAQRTLFELRKEYIGKLTAYHTAKALFERYLGSTTQTTNISESE